MCIVDLMKRGSEIKIVIDRLYAVLFGHPVRKQFVVIMTARGNMYEMTAHYFSIFTRFSGGRISAANFARTKGTGRSFWRSGGRDYRGVS